MDFFGQQDVARRKTSRLVFYFVLATIATIIAVHVAAAGIGSLLYEYTGPKSDYRNHSSYNGYGSDGYGYGVNTNVDQVKHNSFKALLFDPMLFLATAGITTLVVVGGSAYKTLELSGGGEAVASMMGGRRIQSNTSHLGERQLLNIVEEMSLASGVPVPPVYVLDEETSINAFAAGYTIHDAVVAVSQGAITYLTRDELQGVVAHEFSHILNGDMKLNLRLVGIVYGLLVIAIIGLYVVRVSFYSGGGDSRDNRGALLMVAMGFALCVIGVVGYGLGTLIKLSVSRQREFLADAAAVQFTRNPAGIAGALKKIGGRRNTSKIINKHAFEMSHLFFGNAFGRTTGSLFATHPPLVERIRRIDPSFDGNFPAVNPVKHTWQEAQRETKKASASGGPFAPIMATIPVEATIVGPGEAAGAVPGLTGGMPSGVRLAYVAALLQNLPPQLRTATHEAFGARAAIFATLIDCDPEVRAKQLQILHEAGDPACVQEVEFLLKSADQMEDTARLPLVETALPNLKSLSPEQYDRFRSTLTELIKTDGRVDLFEYAVQTLVIRHLDIHFGKKQPAMIRHHHSSIKSILPETVRLLSTLAYVGAQANGDAPVAFTKGLEILKTSASILPKDKCSLRQLGEILEKLNDSVPLLKHQVVDACVAVVMADEHVTPKEHELIQVIGAILEIPVPPLAS